MTPKSYWASIPWQLQAVLLNITWMYQTRSIQMPITGNNQITTKIRSNGIILHLIKSQVTTNGLTYLQRWENCSQSYALYIDCAYLECPFFIKILCSITSPLCTPTPRLLYLYIFLQELALFNFQVPTQLYYTWNYLPSKVILQVILMRFIYNSAWALQQQPWHHHCLTSCPLGSISLPICAPWCIKPAHIFAALSWDLLPTFARHLAAVSRFLLLCTHLCCTISCSSSSISASQQGRNKFHFDQLGGVLLCLEKGVAGELWCWNLAQVFL